MKTISGTPLHDLETLLATLPPFRARQIFDWVYNGAVSFDQMTNLPQKLRNDLSKQFKLRKTKIFDTIKDKDGTVKFQISLDDDSIVESVILIDDKLRKTACLSTQVGCPMGCVFCKTGSLGFLRNLDSSEIVEQFLHIRSFIRSKNPDSSDFPEISNIVFMGMGEPLLNLDELEKAFSVICDQMSGRRITVSTCGIIQGIRKLADMDLNVRLAISLTTADETLRTRLMPVSKQNPLPELKAALQYYQKKQKQRITLECALLHGINTRQEDIQAIVNFSKGLDIIVNLIPWNPVDGLFFDNAPLKAPYTAEVRHFESTLNKYGINTVLRYKKGRDVSGACGQLGVVNYSKNVSRETILTN